MFTIKEIIDAWQKVYGEELPVLYSGFIMELEKRAIKKIINARFNATCFSVWLLFKNVYQY